MVINKLKGKEHSYVLRHIWIGVTLFEKNIWYQLMGKKSMSWTLKQLEKQSIIAVAMDFAKSKNFCVTFYAILFSIATTRLCFWKHEHLYSSLEQFLIQMGHNSQSPLVRVLLTSRQCCLTYKVPWHSLQQFKMSCACNKISLLFSIND